MKAHMQVGDRVLVEPVGVNVTIKRLIPVWKFGKPEPQDLLRLRSWEDIR